MNSKPTFLLATLLALTTGSIMATNPPGGTCSGGGGGCDASSSDSGGTGGSNPPSSQSLEWGIKVGLARYAKPTSLTDFGQAAFELNGNLPDFKQLYGRYFSSNPLQQRQIHLELSQTQLSAATFHPSILFLQSEAVFETLKKPAADGFPEFIHQILTDDAFTLIDVLPAPESGWRLRVWKRDAAALTHSGGFYVTTDFEDPTKATPLNDVVFKRPTGSTGNNTLIYIQNETTGLAGTRTITNEIAQTLDAHGRALKVISKTFSGEGTVGTLLSKEEIDYSERGKQNLANPPMAWDYTIERKVYTASINAAGTLGSLVLTRKTLENYDDFSTVTLELERRITSLDDRWELYLEHPRIIYRTEENNMGHFLPYKIVQPHPVGGLPGMKRLISLTEAHDLPGQLPQVTTNSYVNDIMILAHDPLRYLENPPASGKFDFNVGPPEPRPSLIHGRLQSTVRPDGSWSYNEYVVSSSSPVSIITEYSGWKDITIAQRENARKTVTEIYANDTLTETSIAGQLVSKSRTTLGAIDGDPITTSEQWDGNAWHTTTTAYYPESAAAPSTGRIKWIENSDGTLAAYVYTIVDGQLVTTVRTGAGSREAVIAGLAAGNTNGISAGTQVQTTFHAMHYKDQDGNDQYGIRDFPIAQVTKDIASTLTTEQWTTDPTHHAGFDELGRPIKRIYNGDQNDYDIAQYACCGLEFSRDRMGATITYSRDGLKRVYKVDTKATPAAAIGATTPVISTFTTTDGLTTTTTRRIGDSDSQFLGSTTRSLDGLTTTHIGPSRKSTAVADRPVTTSVIARSATGDTVTTTQADGSTSITAFYLDGQIKSVTGSAVADMTYAYQTFAVLGGDLVAFGLTSVQTASGVTTATQLDELGRVERVLLKGTGPSPRSTTAYTYYPPTAPAGSRGNLQSVTDGDGVTVSYGYNSKGERTTTSRIIPLVGDTTATQVSSTVRDVVSDVTLHGVSIGTSFRTTQSVASIGIAPVTTSESYASIGGLVSGASSFGSQTLNIATRPDASGIATRTSIRPDGTQSVQTTTHGLVTSVQEKSTTGSVITGTSYTYDSLQRPLTVTDLRTGTTTYDLYDNDGELTPDGEADVTESGQPLVIKTAANHTTGFGYDIMGRTIQTTLPDTTITHTAYYSTGQVKVTWGSQTYPTWNVYDEQGRMTQLHTWKIAPTLNPATIHLPTTITPPAGSDVTTWIYGPTTGRLDRKQYADEKGTNYTYTAAGRLESRGWARGITTTYGYEYGLMTSTDYSDTTPDVTITYEPLGRQETVTQTNQSQITYTYDPANLALDTETIRYDIDHNGTYDFTRVLDRSRDALNRDSGFQLKDGTIVENQAAYSYHTTEGRLLNVIGGGDISSPQTFTYGYTPDSNLLHTVTGPVHTVTHTWEPNRDVLDIKQNKVGTDIISKYDYFVNEIGQREEVATSGTAFPAAPSWLWDYDSLGQLITADSSVGTSDRAYQYDSIGNRKKSADSLTLPGTDNYTSNALNQYTAIDTLSPSYDFDGNATAYPLPVAPTALSALVWDGENRQISSTVGSTTTTYLYDAQSRRIATITGGVNTLFVYEGWNCIAEYAGTILSKTRLWGTDLSGSIQGAGGVGGMLAERHHSGTAATYHPTYDGNGNVSEYLASDGSTAAHYEYDPFGRTTLASGSKANDFAYRFSTKPLDSQTGLYYYGYRYYDPVTGRWPSRDPIGEHGGIGLYSFVGNDGVNWVDLFGLQRCQVVVFFGHYSNTEHGPNVQVEMGKFAENAGSCDRHYGLACNTGKNGGGNIPESPDIHTRVGEKSERNENGGNNADVRDFENSDGYNRSGNEGKIDQRQVGWTRLAAKAWKAAIDEAKNMCKTCKDCEVDVEFRCVGNETRKADLQKLRDQRVEATRHLTADAHERFFGNQNPQDLVPNCGNIKPIRCANTSQ